MYKKITQFVNFNFYKIDKYALNSFFLKITKVEKQMNLLFQKLFLYLKYYIIFNLYLS